MDNGILMIRNLMIAAFLRKFTVPIKIKWLFLKHSFWRLHVCKLFLVIKPDQIHQPNNLSHYLFLALLNDILGSESFNLESAWYFPFAPKFWNNSSKALQLPLAVFNKFHPSCSFGFLEGIFMSTKDKIKKKAWTVKYILVGNGRRWNALSHRRSSQNCSNIL